MKKVNLQRPFSATRWLKLIDFDHDPEFLRFKKNLMFTDEYLGFSFETNELGLVPVGSSESSGVIFGTSFACGVGVDVGQRWFDLVPDLASHFNNSFPISPRQLGTLLSENYLGSSDELVIVYHPNFWSFQKAYDVFSKKNMKMLDFYKWRTGFYDVAKIYLKNLIRAPLRYLSGRAIYDSARRLDNMYCVVEMNMDIISSMEATIRDVASRFACVKVYVVPVREQLSKKTSVACRSRLNEQTKAFIDICERLNFTDIHDFSDKFLIDDYHIQDNHWNVDGNLRFAELIKLSSESP